MQSDASDRSGIRRPVYRGQGPLITFPFRSLLSRPLMENYEVWTLSDVRSTDWDPQRPNPSHHS